MYSRHRNVVLAGLLVHAVHHFVGAGVREYHHKIRSTQLALKVRGHLRKHLRLTFI